MEATLLCFGVGLVASFFGWVVVDLAGVVDGLVVGVEDMEDAVVDFLGAAVCLFAVEETFVFLGGSLGIFFFCSGIVECFWIDGEMCLSTCLAVAGEDGMQGNVKGDCFSKEVAVRGR